MMNKIRIWCLEKNASIPTEKEDTVGKEMEKTKRPKLPFYRCWDEFRTDGGLVQDWQSLIISKRINLREGDLAEGERNEMTFSMKKVLENDLICVNLPDIKQTNPNNFGNY